jgi:hypothetical protein
MSNANRNMKAIRSYALDLGYIEKERNKHLKFFHPVTRRLVVVSVSASCYHAMKNAQKDLERNAKI